MISILTASQARERQTQLEELLIDAVDSGASVGFLPPLAGAVAADYWLGVFTAMEEGHRILLAAIEDGEVLGSVQLACETRENGRHRADAMKLFVHRRARRRGLARQLMLAVEEAARERGITLIVMDTRKGGEAEKLCDSLGYVRWGEVPGYARSANGELHATAFYYRAL